MLEIEVLPSGAMNHDGANSHQKRSNPDGGFGGINSEGMNRENGKDCQVREDGR